MPKRFDSKKLYAALSKKRLENNMTWQAVANEIGVSAPTITHTRVVAGWKLTECWRW